MVPEMLMIILCTFQLQSDDSTLRPSFRNLRQQRYHQPEYRPAFRPIRVNKSLLPANLESLHERKWRVHHRKEEEISWAANGKDYEIEEAGVKHFSGSTTKHLYNWLCPLVGQSVGLSVG